MSDLDNPAVKQALTLHPALVDACQKDPELLTELTRGQLAVVQDRMVQMALTNPEVTLSQLAAVHDALTKNAQMKKTEEHRGGGTGFTVVINLGDKNTEKVVSTVPQELPEL